MAYAPIWSSLSNAPPPPSSSEGATLCEIQSLLVPLQTSYDTKRDSHGGNIASQARLATVDVLKDLPAISSSQPNGNLLEGQHGGNTAPGRTGRPSGSRRSLPRSTSMSAGGSAKSAFLSPDLVFTSDDSNRAMLPFVKRAFSRWYQEGWLSALQDLIDNDSPANKCKNSSYVQKIAAATAKVLVSLYSVTSSLHGSLHSSLKVINMSFSCLSSLFSYSYKFCELLP